MPLEFHWVSSSKRHSSLSLQPSHAHVLHPSPASQDAHPPIFQWCVCAIRLFHFPFQHISFQDCLVGEVSRLCSIQLAVLYACRRRRSFRRGSGRPGWSFWFRRARAPGGSLALHNLSSFIESARRTPVNTTPLESGKFPSPEPAAPAVSCPALLTGLSHRVWLRGWARHTGPRVVHYLNTL